MAIRRCWPASGRCSRRTMSEPTTPTPTSTRGGGHWVSASASVRRSGFAARARPHLEEAPLEYLGVNYGPSRRVGDNDTVAHPSRRLRAFECAQLCAAPQDEVICG